MDECIFCKIIKGEIPSSKVYEDDKVFAFKDINPAAPIHVLVIPKEHISSLNDVNEENSKLIAHVFVVISKLAKELGIDEDGFRVVSNCGEAAGQTVQHVHFHLLAKKKFTWPPG
ncbi:histidine triad nucleotide-binding protein [Clostridium felsineum]|uniref:Purine nucleoside phosphoramidase n=1 Tax=Clostridium felsineum TaxID=36839 RepID=A0A1S8LA49_9CLOT|nr:histidine triad nucleotide-binding protein [Clostridium felsineum]MCR3758197.1 histidine triad nucleotide-binding protein [Clostridium felsineum]URZ01151.1 Purine nucleoside phosphoramidase [Clostridium felsineum]URZ06094.1 Purine nucleoside phosphoramidase [Clostridium felsineum]URZ11131.1 Purine nucleoside phosphoramidase [Clostridium felsineum]URZ15759.1 Purine nucleoside phosphoramidase [Clostridium felsineum DSM 794]